MSTTVLLRALRGEVVDALAARPEALAALRANPSKNANALKLDGHTILGYWTWKAKHERISVEAKLFEAIVSALRELRIER